MPQFSECVFFFYINTSMLFIVDFSYNFNVHVICLYNNVSISFTKK